jgi:signal transduction histidine kinase
LNATEFELYKLDDQKIAQRVMKNRVEILRERMLSAALTSPVATIFLALTQATIAGSGPAIRWFCLINFFEFFIVCITHQFKSSHVREQNEELYLKWMIFAEFLMGLAWGCSVWFFWVEGHTEFYFLNLVVLVGVLGICIVVLSSFLNAMALFSAGLLLPIIIHLFIVPEQLKLPIIAGAIILFFLILQYTRLAEKTLVVGLVNAERLDEISSELIHRTKNLSDLSAHIDQTEEQERLRISREIHDEMGGNLAAMKMSLHIMEKNLPADQIFILEKIRYMEGLIDRTIDAGHRIARGLRPGILDLGIIPALEWQVEEFKKQYFIKCAFSTNSTDVILSPDHATALFRMAQEALTNAAKHSEATQVSVVIISLESKLVMRIIDNGCGFEVKQSLKPNCFGLLGMSERCKELGGTFSVESQVARGCAITVEIPVA